MLTGRGIRYHPDPIPYFPKHNTLQEFLGVFVKRADGWYV